VGEWHTLARTWVNGQGAKLDETCDAGGGGHGQAQGKQSEYVEKAVEAYEEAEAHAALESKGDLPEFADD
jgi:hypothetical protein